MTSKLDRLGAAPLLLALSGPSGAGKTTLAEHLVRTWVGAGIRVGYAKHASHGFQMDRPGKDSARLTEAGAAGVAVTGPAGTAFLEAGAPSTAADLARRFFPDAELVVVEGFREERLPTVLLAGETAPVEPPDGDASRVLAGYGPASRRDALRAVLGARPVFDRGQLDGLVALLDAWRSSLGTSGQGASRRAAGVRPAMRLVAGGDSVGAALRIRLAGD